MNQRNLITMSASQTSPGTLLAPLPVQSTVPRCEALCDLSLVTLGGRAVDRFDSEAVREVVLLHDVTGMVMWIAVALSVPQPSGALVRR